MVVYPTGALDLWTLFVVYVAGSFWAAVVFLAVVMTLIMMMGKVSPYSIITFMLMFFLCMAMGYGYVVLSIPIAIFIVIRFTAAVITIINWLRQAM